MNLHLKKFLQLLFYLILVAMIGLLMAFKQSPGKKNMNYHAVSIEFRTITQSIQVSGIIESENLITIRSKISGTLQHNELKEGTFIKKGQVLAKIHNPKILDDVLLNENNLQLAKLNVEDAKRNLTNGSTLYKLKSITTEEYIRLQTLYQKSKYELQHTEKSYEYALTDKNDLIIQAPFEGEIIQIIEDNGSDIVAGTKLFIIANMDVLTAKMAVDEQHASLIYEGQPVELKNNTTTETYIQSKIFSISQMIDNTDMKGILFLKCPYISHNQSDITLGSSINGNIIIQTKHSIPTLPLNAIWQTNGKKFVYLIQNNTINNWYIQ